ncbi:MAG: LTA synthase family protein [Lachnospiraceae bacterium]|nr:LTA synthase family protein [Lachnospiraceae bacterium]
MKNVFSKVGKFFKNIGNKIKGTAKKIPTPKFVTKLKENEKLKKVTAFLNKYSIIAHIPLSLAMCFVIEWMSRHSFLDACSFVGEHPGAYLYNSFVIFVVYSLCYLFKRQTLCRMIVSAVFVTLGITNCIVLLNRVTPFGFTDLNMITDLLTMQGTNYFSVGQGLIAIAAIVIYALLMVKLFRKGKKVTYKMPFWLRALLVALLFTSLPFTTKFLQKTEVLAAYFGNLQQGYFDYGFLYGFATSAFDRGMSKPIDYNEENVLAIVDETSNKSTIKEDKKPNIIVVLLESHFDVSQIDFIKTSEDPIPYFHSLEEEFSTGQLTVPVVGAGTCNTEFEILTGMSCQFLGPGEYPQKTVLKEIDRCESVASDLRNIGYSSHVVHNNGGNFYSRAHAFTLMGFDTFQSKEMLDIVDYTPMGSWPKDDILIGASMDAMDSTPGADMLYTITVGTHGDYPKVAYPDDQAIKVQCEGKTEELTNQWTYYINRLHEMDTFMKNYCETLNQRDEDTIVIFFGDHLPTMGLTEDEISTHDLYKTKYVIWNNFGMSKADMDMTSYQLVPMFLDRLGIHEGTMINYNQDRTKSGVSVKSEEYTDGLNLLQYDLLYGKRYAYRGQDLYPASNLVMGVKDVIIDRMYNFNDEVHIYGQNFTKWSKVFVNGKKVATGYKSGQCLTIDTESVKNGDKIVVNQLGSSDTVFRTSNEVVVNLPQTEQTAAAAE